ncbi:MAG TPA: enoyl-CoA hydratase-related protein [Burkholderiaceae bacterium]|nr:enoyl-CoA hydratase-related protein [Burkholderiaceae bacterium]
MSIRLDRAADGIWTLELCRPEKLNALTDDMVRQLDDMLTDIGRQPACRVLLLTGAGRGFCTGFDLGLARHAPGSDDGEAAAWTLRQEAFAGLVTRLRSLRQPVVAAVNGAASGAGLGLALACDLRIASSTARFNAAFIKVGMSGCDIGVSWLLPRCIGTAHAFEMLLTGRMVEADEAERIGLVSRVVPADGLLDEARALAAVVAGHEAFAVWMTKRGMWANLEAPSLQAALELENRTQILTRTTGRLAEAARALTGGGAG